MRRWFALLVLAGAAHADSAPGTIVFTRFGSVYERPADGGGDIAQIAGLPDDASEVKFVEATRDGKLIVLDMASYSIWLASSGADRPIHVQGGPCTGRARPAPAGDLVVCTTADGPSLLAAVGNKASPLTGTLDEVQFRGPTGAELVALADEGVVGLDRKKPDDREVLAKPGARSHLLVAPDGDLAVAVFGEGAEGRVRSFVLDGKGTSRQLGGPGTPTLWSWDSTWVMFQEGDIKNAPAPGQGDEGLLEASPDPWLLGAPGQGQKRSTPKRPGGKRAAPQPPPPTTRLCVARAIGGEVKCWDGFTGMAFSPDSTLVLLKREKSLYIGKIAGVRPDPPVKILDDVDGAATWVPAPVGLPLAPPKPASGDFWL